MKIVKLLSRTGLALFLLFSFPLIVFAQGTIEGTAYDSDTGDALPGAQVLIPSLSLGGVTDLDGAYAIENVPAGDYQLEVRFIGYSTARKSVTVVSGQTVTVDFTLGASAINLDEVVVTGAGGPG